MSTDLYKEAIAEAQKLKEIAEEDAKKSISEEIAPFIRKMIAEQIGGQASTEFFIEQDEELEDPNAPAGDQASDPSSEVQTSDPVSDDDLAAGLGDQPEEAPVEPGADEDVINASMPDEEGKITVDFEDLFSDAEEEDTGVDGDSLDLGDDMAPEPAGAEEEQPEMGLDATEEPQAAEPTQPATTGTESPEEDLLPTESVNYEDFQKSLSEAYEKVDRVFYQDSVSEIVQESLKTRLFSLLEQNDKLKEAGILNSKKAKINENKLEFLFLKLKEANLNNSYLEKDQRDKNNMTSLKEIAAKLFEEDSSTYAEDGDKEGTNQPTTSDGKHAADVSGVDPELGQSGPEDLKGREEDGNSGGLAEEMLPGSAGSVDHEPLPNTDPEPGSEEQWADGEPSLDEEDQDKVIEEALSSLEEEVDAEGASGFGDTEEDPAVEFEVDEKEIAEAVRNIRKENIKRKMKALKEASDGDDTSDSWEDAEPEGDRDPSHENLKESVKTLREDDDMDDMDDMGMGADVDDVAGADMDDDMDDMGMEEDMDDGDLVLSVDLPDEVEDALAGSEDLGDFEVDVVDVNLDGDDGDMDDVMSGDVDSVVPDAGEAVEDVVMGDDMASDEDEMEEGYMRKEAAYRARLKKASKLTEGLKRQNRKLKAELREANLFLAKNVYFTKFLQRGDLSRKNLTKIVEYLDNAKSVKEAKSVYGKIKTKLNESTKASKKLAGSAAKVTKPGSAASLNESVSRKSPGGGPEQTVSRWQQLAGVRKGES